MQNNLNAYTIRNLDKTAWKNHAFLRYMLRKSQAVNNDKAFGFYCIYMQILEQFPKSILVYSKHSKFVHIYTFIPTLTHSSLFIVIVFLQQQNEEKCLSILTSCWFKNKGISHINAEITTLNISFKFWARNSKPEHK